MLKKVQKHKEDTTVMCVYNLYLYLYLLLCTLSFGFGLALVRQFKKVTRRSIEDKNGHKNVKFGSTDLSFDSL